MGLLTVANRRGEKKCQEGSLVEYQLFTYMSIGMTPMQKMEEQARTVLVGAFPSRFVILRKGSR
jgi:hypothetical protein